MTKRDQQKLERIADEMVKEAQERESTVTTTKRTEVPYLKLL